MCFLLERGKRFFGVGMAVVCFIVFGGGAAFSKTPVSSLVELYDVREDLDGNFVLTADIDASPTNPDKVDFWVAGDYIEGDWVKYEDAGTVKTYYCHTGTTDGQLPTDTDFWREMWVSSEGWAPICKPNTRPSGDFAGTFAVFCGTFDGAGHTISDLYIYRPSGCTSLYSNFEAGLFAHLSDTGSGISNVHLHNVQITGGNGTGGLVGWASGRNNEYTSARIINSSVSGSVTGGNNVGGIAGIQSHSVIEDSSFSGSVVGDTSVGGLVGSSGSSTSKIIYSHAEGSVAGNDHVGGLVGYFFRKEIIKSYSTSSVTGNSYVGGLVGRNQVGDISESFATGDVTGAENVGGLVGYNDLGGIFDSFSGGDVLGTASVGGLVGYNATIISNSFSRGKVGGDSDAGGFVGVNTGTVSNSFWDVDRDGLDTESGDDNFGATGKITAEMQDIATFTDTDTDGLDESWDFDDIWDIDRATNRGYPFLNWQPVLGPPDPDPEPDPEPDDDDDVYAPRRRRPSPSPAPEPEPAYPAPPAGFKVDPRDGIILSNLITWNETPEISSYKLYVSTGGSSGAMAEVGAESFEFWLLGEFSPDTFEYTHTGLSGVRYYYVITSVNEEGLESNVTSPVYWANPGTGEYGWLDALDWPGNTIEKPEDGGSSCFIATAAYGSPLSLEVSALRAFRDGFLFSNVAGTRLVGAYYEMSPVFAGAIAESGILRKVAQLHLAPFVRFAGVLTNMN